MEIWENRALSLADRSPNLTLKFETISTESAYRVNIGDFPKALLAEGIIKYTLSSQVIYKVRSKSKRKAWVEEPGLSILRKFEPLLIAGYLQPKMVLELSVFDSHHVSDISEADQNR